MDTTPSREAGLLKRDPVRKVNGKRRAKKSTPRKLERGASRKGLKLESGDQQKKSRRRIH